MRILVTGATGFIGQHLVAALVAQPDTAVSILIREAYSHADLKPLPSTLANLRDQLNIVYADLRNFKLTVRAIEQATPDCVIHLAAAGVTDPFLGINTALRHNLDGTLNLLRACFEKTFTTQQLIVGRTPGELTNMNVYATSKASAWNFCEMFARTQQWPIHGVMIFQAYGAGQTDRALIPAAIKAALADQDFPMTAGTQSRDWIYIDDLIAGFTALISKALPPATTVALGTGIATAVADVVRQIYALVDGNGRPRIGTLPSRPGEENLQIADVALTKELIGWETAVSLSQGLQKTIKHLKNSSSGITK
ncbi:MAG: NAD(P)-dependent oxidoreductase [Chloroflexi bacterium]|nr:NAD(P)-dependent oxidoreductase [Chloroflexota bacterium]